MLTPDPRVEWNSFMRIAAALGALLIACSAAIPHSASAAAPSVEELFRQFDLFGNWAIDCGEPAASANPHVAITMPGDGQVQEEHDLGAEFALNRYSIEKAARLSPERLAIEVLFQPEGAEPQRQRLVLLVRKGTRRTMFNQPDGGEVRVKDGIALARHVKTPVLKKCE